MYCFVLVAGFLAHPVQTTEAIDGMLCFEDGAKMVAAMMAPPEERQVFDAKGNGQPDPAAVAFLEARQAEAQRNAAIDRLLEAE